MYKSPATTLERLQSSLAETGEPVQTSTKSPAVHRSGLYGRVSRTKPLLRKILWCPDENTVDPFGLKPKHKVGYKPNPAHYPSNAIPLIKHGGVMLLGCLSADGTRKLDAITSSLG